MTCELLRGAPVAAALDEKTAIQVEKLRTRGIDPGLAILRAGEREDDIAYENAAVRRCTKLGIKVRRVTLPGDVSQTALISAIEELNQDETVHGILMFRPLPAGLDEKAACEAIAPAKDVDGVSTASQARVYSGSGTGFAPCTAQACMELLRHYNVEISGKNAAVVGRSLVIGRPVAMLLSQANATVTICHSRTRQLPHVVRQADIVVAALGKAEALGAEYFGSGQTVIDVGINWSEAKARLVGDVEQEAAAQIVSRMSPVPGGVGSVTTAVLAAHVCQAAEINCRS